MMSIDRFFGCVFCKTNQEDAVAKRMTAPSLKAYPVVQAKHKSENGKKSYTFARVFPGYVFFESDEKLDIKAVKRILGVLTVLGDGDAGWVLTGSDREFARWIVDNRGMINVSLASWAGNKVVFRTGFLKDYEGWIVKVDKHRGNAVVELVFSGVQFRIWVAFEWVDTIN